MHIAFEGICRDEQRLEYGHDAVDGISKKRSSALRQKSKLAVRSVERKGGIVPHQNDTWALGDMCVVRDVKKNSAKRALVNPLMEDWDKLRVRNGRFRRENLGGQAADLLHTPPATRP